MTPVTAKLFTLANSLGVLKNAGVLVRSGVFQRDRGNAEIVYQLSIIIDYYGVFVKIFYNLLALFR